MSTKERILNESKLIFNQSGYGAANLYHVAQALGISRGNLTYHFKDKAALLEVHLERMYHRFQEGLSQSVMIPSWQSLQNATEDFFRVQKEYAFIFFDKAVLELPQVKSQLMRVRKKNIKVQMAMINVSIQMGNMHPERISGVYHNLSRSIWMICSVWQLSKRLKEKEESGWDKIVWSLLLPHFTDKGFASFKEHFGSSFYENLGVPYRECFHELKSF